MITKKEFYFVRHGQTDHNVRGILSDGSDVSLNDMGRDQAQEIREIISGLPIRTICHSPLKRAIETMEIVTTEHAVDRVEISNLGECNAEIWKRMVDPEVKECELVRSFIEKTRDGTNTALQNEGPVLIVAHGGVHWAICSLMGVEHDWVIDNCVPVRFSIANEGHWHAQKLL